MPDLCSLPEVRSFLQKPAGDTDQDALINQLLPRATALITRDTRREFFPTVAAVRSFEMTGDGWLEMAPFEIRTVTEVKDMSANQVLPATDWRGWPTASIEGTFLSLRVDRDRMYDCKPRLIRVTGDWGLAAVPEDIKHAAVVTIAIWLRRDVSAFSTVFNVDEQQVERPETLPASVRAALRPWRR